jgi:hypothetical protein
MGVRHRNLRLFINTAMLVLLMASLAYRWTGNPIHEWNGIFLLVLTAVHNIFNGAWYRKSLSPKGVRAYLKTIIDLLLLVSVVVLMGSATLISRTLFPFLHGEGSVMARQVHVSAAYWFLLLVSAHLGFHWAGVLDKTVKWFGVVGKSRLFWKLMRLAAFAILVVGMKEFMDRGILPKMVLYYSFEAPGPEESLVSCLFAHLSIMGAFVFMTHDALKLNGGVETKN